MLKRLSLVRGCNDQSWSCPLLTRDTPGGLNYARSDLIIYPALLDPTNLLSFPSTPNFLEEYSSLWYVSPSTPDDVLKRCMRRCFLQSCNSWWCPSMFFDLVPTTTLDRTNNTCTYWWWDLAARSQCLFEGQHLWIIQFVSRVYFKWCRRHHTCIQLYMGSYSSTSSRRERSSWSNPRCLILCTIINNSQITY